MVKSLIDGTARIGTVTERAARGRCLGQNWLEVFKKPRFRLSSAAL